MHFLEISLQPRTRSHLSSWRQMTNVDRQGGLNQRHFTVLLSEIRGASLVNPRFGLTAWYQWILDLNSLIGSDERTNFLDKIIWSSRVWTLTATLLEQKRFLSACIDVKLANNQLNQVVKSASCVFSSCYYR